MADGRSLDHGGEASGLALAAGRIPVPHGWGRVPRNLPTGLTMLLLRGFNALHDRASGRRHGHRHGDAGAWCGLRRRRASGWVSECWSFPVSSWGVGLLMVLLVLASMVIKAGEDRVYRRRWRNCWVARRMFLAMPTLRPHRPVVWDAEARAGRWIERGGCPAVHGGFQEILLDAVIDPWCAAINRGCPGPGSIACRHGVGRLPRAWASEGLEA